MSGLLLFSATVPVLISGLTSTAMLGNLAPEENDALVERLLARASPSVPSPPRMDHASCNREQQCDFEEHRKICVADPLAVGGRNTTRCADLREIWKMFYEDDPKPQASSTMAELELVSANETLTATQRRQCTCSRFKCEATNFCGKKEESSNGMNNPRFAELASNAGITSARFAKARAARAAVVNPTALAHSVMENGVEVLHVGSERIRGYESHRATMAKLAKIPSVFVGCLPMETGTTPPTTYMDTSCMGASTVCHGGLPFFRLASTEPSSTSCVQLCVSKGLDVAGLARYDTGGECRCGISKAEVGLLAEEDANMALIAPLGQATAPSDSSSSCGMGFMDVYKYSGSYVDGSIPPKYHDLNIDEVSYIDAVLTGKWHYEEDEPDSSDVSAMFQTALAGKNKREWNRKCYPSKCGAGTPWPKTNSAYGVWSSHSKIKYCFKSGTDQARKDVFYAAKNVWEANVCVKFERVSCTSAFFSGVNVGNHKSDSCSATLGKRFGWNRKINLGWCNNMVHLGSVEHEIGHTLGMNHRQKAKDAATQYYGYGPHLTIYWNNIPSDWKSQYQSDGSTYMGSANDGSGDPFSGRTTYDFGSLMHYGRYLNGVKVMETVPTGRTIGQRNAPSALDYRQVKDMYQCKRRYFMAAVEEEEQRPVQPEEPWRNEFTAEDEARFEEEDKEFEQMYEKAAPMFDCVQACCAEQFQDCHV